MLADPIELGMTSTERPVTENENERPTHLDTSTLHESRSQGSVRKAGEIACRNGLAHPAMLASVQVIASRLTSPVSRPIDKTSSQYSVCGSTGVGSSEQEQPATMP